MLGKRRMPMDVWIGADGLVRRVAYRMAIPVAATGGTLTTTVSLDMFAFGAPVHVAAPPAAPHDRPHRCCRGGCRLRIVSPA